MNDFEDSAMIALLPTRSDWCTLDLPHMTIVYAGEISKLKITDFNALAKDAAAVAMISSPLIVKVTGVETFGPPEDRVDVLTLAPTPEVLAIRNLVENWNASSFPDFKPHATIGPEGSGSGDMFVTPSFLVFDRIVAAWGNDSMTFWLKKPTYS